MRNLKNITHWIAELREIAYTKYRLRNEDGDILTKEMIETIFNKDLFEQKFNNGLTPEEAIKEELKEWRC